MAVQQGLFIFPACIPAGSICHAGQASAFKQQLQQHAVLCCATLLLNRTSVSSAPCSGGICALCPWPLCTLLQGSMFLIQEVDTLEATLALGWDMCAWCPSDPSSTFWQAGRLADVSIMPPWLHCASPPSASLIPLQLAASSTDLPRSACRLLHRLLAVCSQTSKMPLLSVLVPPELNAIPVSLSGVLVLQSPKAFFA